MDSSRGLLFYVLTVLVSLASAIDQHPLQPTETVPKRVAIIGAGAGGSSSAYHLRKYADSSSSKHPLDITVFERAPYIGGRSTTVNVFNNPAYPVELGASIFVQVNQHLVNASRDLGLTLQSASYARPKESKDTLGIWDGSHFVFSLTDSSSWWNIARLIWRYGFAPVRAQSLMKAAVGKFLGLYDEPVFPFASLSDAVEQLGLLEYTAVSGGTILEKNNVSPEFARDIVQASTRVNYGQNLGLIHGLEAMVCMAAEGAMSVEGGNWRIFEGMLNASGAEVKLNNAVTGIERNPDGSLTLVSTSTSTSAEEEKEEEEEKQVFDDLILAAPLQSSNLSLNPPLSQTPDPIPYVTLHVTLFSSPHRLSPRFFGLNENDSAAQIPETILTTLPKGTHLGSNRDGVGPPGFWSISTLQTIRDDAGERHYVYKIFSPRRPTASFISQLLGLDENSSTTSTNHANSSITDLPKTAISWSHEKTWNPYPFLYPRVTFDEPPLARNMWYTSGIEGFISTMETSALMGRNVAALVWGSWMDQDRKIDRKADKDGGTGGSSGRTEL